MQTHTLAALLAVGLASTPLLAQTFPANFAATNLATGLSFPTAMAVAPNGDVYICQQAGALRVWQNGVGVSTVNTFATTLNGERGLLGVALDPAFATNRFIYVYYTVSVAPIHNRVARITVNAAGTAAIAGSEIALIDLDNLSGATNHNGGAVHFGLDGKLYIGVGENANGANSQTLANRLGKILRINADGTIPVDNPTTIANLGTPTGLNRAIWAAGLRNPYTFAVHPITGRIFINDVGNSTWEEINDGIAGVNYGWSTTEGFFTQSSFPNFTLPLIAYHHSNGALNNPAALGSFTGQAIVGGTFYSPFPGVNPNFPISFNNIYFFGDEVAGFIRTFDPVANSGAGFATGVGGTVDLAVAPNNTLFSLSGAGGGSGVLRRITYNGVSGICCTGTTCTLSNGLNCTGTGVFTWGTSVCNPNPCAPAATGACCNGTTCSIATQAACSPGAYQGDNTACGIAGNPTTCCPANFNASNGLSVQDIFDFLAAYFASDLGADFNHSGVLGVQDIFDFLAAYFAGCP